VWRSAREDATSTVRFALVSGGDNGTGMDGFAFAADGRSFVYAARDASGIMRLHLRALDQLRPVVLEGTDGAGWPVFSPDGEWIAFQAAGQLKKVRRTGGTPVVLASNLVNNRRTAWLERDIVLSNDGRLLLVSANGGPLRPVPGDTGAAQGTRWYPISIGNDRIVFTNWRGYASTATLSVVDIRTGRVDSLGLRGSYALGVVAGHLIFINELRGVAAIAIDANGRVSGEAVTLLSEAEGQPGSAAVSANGSLVYQPRALQDSIVLRRGGERRVISPRPGEWSFPRLSPDGKRVVVGLNAPGRADIFVLTLADGAVDRLSLDGIQNSRPEWTPDGQVIYLSDRGGSGRLGAWVQPIDRSAPPRRLVEFANRDVWEASLTSDGKYVVYRTGTLSSADAWFRRVEGDTNEIAIGAREGPEQAPRVSPDGRWVTYGSTESGSAEVYVKPFPSLSARYQVSKGGRDGWWGPDSRTLYYSSGRDILRATLQTSGAFSVSRIDTVVRGEVRSIPGHQVGDIGRDGSMVYVVGSEVNTPAIVIAGWARELKLRGN
jgi:eukaryotic-like serine/threonine-protein kinase